MERFIIGRSEAVEAEYSIRANGPITLLFLTDEEPVSIEGFLTFEAAMADLKENGVSASQIEYVG